MLNENIISSQEMLERIKNMPPVRYYASGVPTLDRAIEGFVEGEMVVLTGSVKSGKSLFMRTMINNMYKRERVTPLVFSFEEQPRWFFRNFTNMTGDILFYLPEENTAYNWDWMRKMILKSKEELGTKVVFIDHGHYLFNIADDGNVAYKAGQIAREIKQLATKQGLIIFLIWHIKHAKVETIDQLDFSLLRDSGLVAGECDTCIGVFRRAESDGIVQVDDSALKVLLARRTGALNRIIPTMKVGDYLGEIKYEEEDSNAGASPKSGTVSPLHNTPETLVAPNGEAVGAIQPY